MQALRIVLLGLAAALLLAVGLGGWHRPFPRRGGGSAGDAQARANAAIEERIAAAPEFATFFRHLKSTFPVDFQAEMVRGAERLSRMRHLDTPEAYLIDATGVLRRSRGALAAQASDAALLRLFEVRAEVMKALAATDPKLCVGFLYGTATAGFEAFATSHRALVAEMAESGLQAILDGETSGIRRPAPDDATFQKIDEELTKRGFARPEIVAVLDGRTADPPPPDDRLCAAAIAYLDIVHALPDAERMPVYALSMELMARS